MCGFLTRSTVLRAHMIPLEKVYNYQGLPNRIYINLMAEVDSISRKAS